MQDKRDSNHVHLDASFEHTIFIEDFLKQTTITGDTIDEKEEILTSSPSRPYL